MDLVLDVADIGRYVKDSKWPTIRSGSLASIYVAGQLRDLLNDSEVTPTVEYELAYMLYEDSEVASNSGTDSLYYYCLKHIKDKAANLKVEKASVTDTGLLLLKVGT